MGEGRGADLEVRQTGGPLLGATPRVGADPRGPVAVRVGVPGLLDVVPGRHLPGVGYRTEDWWMNTHMLGFPLPKIKDMPYTTRYPESKREY